MRYNGVDDEMNNSQMEAGVLLAKLERLGSQLAGNPVTVDSLQARNDAADQMAGSSLYQEFTKTLTRLEAILRSSGWLG